MSNETQTPQKKGLTTTHIILIVGFVVVIAVAVGLFVSLNKDKTPEPTEMQGEGSVVINNEEDLADALPSDNNMFYISMNTNWTFPDSETESVDAVLGNSELNPTDMFVTVMLPDGTELYRSPQIPPGANVEGIKLNQKLNPGTYEAICVHHVLYEDGTEETQVNMGVNLIILA